MSARGRSQALEEAALQVGRVIDHKWRLDRPLGVGGWATVYAATHRNGNRVALKLLHASLSFDRRDRTRFLREGYVANKIHHPNVPKVVDDGITADGRAYLVMDLLEGELLDERVMRKAAPLEPLETLVIADQLLEVLAAAHKEGIVHRDIKPSNIFITYAGRVTVLDFGVARLLELGSKTLTATKAGQLLGTPSFMPREQARGRWGEVDGRSDLWAVGATLYWSLTGRQVYEAETANEVLLAAMTGSPRPIREAAPDLPEPVAAVVDRALRVDRDERWSSAATMRSAVRKAYRAVAGRSIERAPPLFVPRKSDPPATAPRWPTESEEETLVVARSRTSDANLEPAGVAAPTSIGPASEARRQRVARSSRLLWIVAGLAGGAAVMTLLWSRSSPENRPADPAVESPSAADTSSAPAPPPIDLTSEPTPSVSNAAATAAVPSTAPPAPSIRRRAPPPPRPAPRPKPKGWLDRFE